MKFIPKLRVIFLFSALMGMVLLTACQARATPAGDLSITEIGQRVDVEGGFYTNLSVSELQRLMDDKDFLLINVHVPFEGNLPKTDLSIPYDRVAQNLDQFPSDKDAKIILYCRSDRMSNIAAQELVKLGFTNIWNLVGGMAAWQQEGLSIEE